jgi:SAM-dependent methyltransferase
MIKRLQYLMTLGVASSATLILDRLFKRKSEQFRRLFPQIVGTGIEIGGPSRVFMRNGYCPVYEHALRVDNVNFASNTAWHGEVNKGGNFVYSASRAPGKQYICNAGDLKEIPDTSYDFVLSSHMLEHSANPLKLLFEWKRVLKPDGVMLLVLPHKDKTFDHRRALTTKEHFLEDYNRDTQENDQTHLAEIIEKHDLSRDRSQISLEAFQQWIKHNFENRGAHHHVFNSINVAQLMDMAGLKITKIEPRLPFDIFIYAMNAATFESGDNDVFLSSLSTYLSKSPFDSDRNVRLKS